MFARVFHRSIHSLLLLTSCWFVFTFPVLAEGDWASFRGPHGDGIAHALALVSGHENPVLRVRWHEEIGSGYSGVSVVGDRLVTLYADGEQDVVAAFATADGRELWRRPLGPTYRGHDGSHDGPISTPLVADGKVFALGPWGDFAAYALADGRELWRHQLAEEQGIAKPHYGFGTSPLMMGGVVVIELGGESTAVAGFDPASGERRWTTGDDGVSYQSPIAWTFEGRQQVVAVGNEKLLGIDPANGELLWQFPHGGDGGRGMGSLTPVPAGEGRLFLTHQNDGSAMVELRSEGGQPGLETLWEGRAIRNSYNVPIYHEGYLYAFSSRILTCVEAASGEVRWRSREPGDGFLALVDGHLVVSTKKGGVHLVEATPEAYREVTAIDVFGDFAWTPPSIAGGAIYARGLAGLARLDVVAAGTKVADGSAATDDSAFARFIATVETAEAGEKASLVDAFFAGRETFPPVEGRWVHFVYRGAAQDVALAGDLFGARREEPMHRVEGTDLFYRTVELAPAARVQYLFLVDYEPTVDPLNDRRVDFSVLGPDMEMARMGAGLPMSWVSLPGWRAPDHLTPAPEAQRGRLERQTFASERIEHQDEGEKPEVEIQVYLPRGYDAEGGQRYPVAYVHGGDTAIEHGVVPNSLDHLVGERVAPVIAVFVSIPARGPAYEEVFLEEVVTRIDSGYPTLAEPVGRANVGTGFAAIQALLITLDHPDLFAKVGLQSPFLFSQLKTMVIERLGAEREAELPRIYLDWGTYDLRNPHEAWDMASEARALYADLRAAGLEPLGGEAADGTGWASWRNRTDALYSGLFPLGAE